MFIFIQEVEHGMVKRSRAFVHPDGNRVPGFERRVELRGDAIVYLHEFVGQE